MPPPRVASSSALTGPKSNAHARRSSRLPLSPSTHVQLPSSPHTSPPTPSENSIPPLTYLIGATVDRLIRSAAPKHTRKFVIDQRLALQHTRPFILLKFLVVLFIILFILLFFTLRAVFGIRPSQPPPHSPAAAALHANLARVARGEEPNQHWPSADALAHAFSPIVPLTKSVSPADVLAARAAANRGWRRTRPAPPVRVSLIAACQDRSAFLQTALPGWCAALAPHDEIVIVDWGTRAPDHVPVATLVHALPELLEGRVPCEVSVVNVVEPGAWVLSRAYNLAARFARGEWLFKVDCDTMLGEDVLGNVVLPRGEVRSAVSGRLPARADEDRFFYRYFWEHALTDNEQHLNGVFLARAEDFRRVNGFDERITTYGWDDSDLYLRLEKEGAGDNLGLRAVDFKPGALTHMKHGDAYRGANQHLIMGPTLETQVNQQATAALPSWTKLGTIQETEYEYDLVSRDGRFALAKIVRTPRALLEHLSRYEQTTIIDEATNRLLHDVYGFPWGVLGEINRSRAELVRSLALLGRATHWQSGNGFIFAEVGGTIPERLLGMASAIALAMEYERPLFLAWSSGTREDPTPRITDFFDVDSSGVVDEETDGSVGQRPRKGARVYQVGRWKCRSVVEVCAKTDTAFKLLSEYRSGGHSDDRRAAQVVLNVLHGKVPGKRNVLLRLEGSFPLQKVEERARALASLTPSHALTDHFGKFGDLSQHLGIYVGRGVKQRGVEAMVKRVKAHHGESAKYFVSGAQREMVDVTRKMLKFEENLAASARDIVSIGSTKEIRETVRDIAELYGLAHCKSMVNDGRPPAAVLDIMSLLKR